MSVQGPNREVVPTHVLDFLPGIAAAYVVINHTRGAFFKRGERTLDEATAGLGIYDYVSIGLLQGTILGAEFVVLFFCVSGFAMAHLLAYRPSTSDFYVRRVIRIWPPNLAAVFLAALVCLRCSRYQPNKPIVQRRSAQVSGLLMIATYLSVSTDMTPQFWSLPYEVIF